MINFYSSRVAPVAFLLITARLHFKGILFEFDIRKRFVNLKTVNFHVFCFHKRQNFPISWVSYAPHRPIKIRL